MNSNWDLSEGDLPSPEPRVGFVDSTGHPVSIDEVARGTGRYQWTIDDAEGIPPGAVALVNEGMNAGGSGDLAAAMKRFRESHRLAPRWAQPVYQGAWTAVLMGDAELAESLYSWTDRMVPNGYWTAKTALDCLRRERSREFPKGTYERYVRLESEPDDRRRRSLEEMVERLPTFAPAWKDLAVLRTSADERAAAIEHGLASSPDRETRGFLLLHKAELLMSRGMTNEALALLRTLLDPGTGTLQTASLARVQLAAAENRTR